MATCANHTLEPATHTVQMGGARRPREVALCEPCAAMAVSRGGFTATEIPGAEPDTVKVPRAALQAVLDLIDRSQLLLTAAQMEPLITLHDALAGEG